MNCIWLDGSKGFKESMSFSDIDEKTYKLIEEEEAIKGKRLLYQTLITDSAKFTRSIKNTM